MNFQKNSNIVLLTVIIFCMSCETQYKGGKTYNTESEIHTLSQISEKANTRFELISKAVSPNKEHVYYHYKLKAATDDLDLLVNPKVSYYTVVKNTTSDVNLTKGRIPTQYKIKAWTATNELLLVKDTITKMRVGYTKKITTGDIINGVKVIVVE